MDCGEGGEKRRHGEKREERPSRAEEEEGQERAKTLGAVEWGHGQSECAFFEAVHAPSLSLRVGVSLGYYHHTSPREVYTAI